MNEVKVSVITSLYRCIYYLKDFLKHLSKTDDPDQCEFIFVHNDPTKEEIDIIEKFIDDSSLNITHLKVGRESLYSSWNRAASCAKGNYLTIWNVDDVRLPDSIKEQAAALNSHSDAAISYGDIIIVSEYNSQTGIVVNEPQYSPQRKSFLYQHHIGCFPMWRKSVHEKIGYFDEQYRIVADLDFQIRVAKRFPLIKVNKQLGFYLAGTPNNLSSNAHLQDMEHTALHLRHGNWDMLSMPYLILAMEKIKISSYKWFGMEHSVSQWSGYNSMSYVKSIPLLFISLFKSPRHFGRRYLKPYIYKYYSKK